MRELKRNSRVNESAYSSALNEVRYDVEHDFKPLEGKGGIYVGLDDVHYDFDELSATVFVLDKNDKVIDEEIVSIPVDSMKDYTTREIRDMTDLMLEKINEVAENLRDSYDAYYSTKESQHFSRRRGRKINESSSDNRDLLVRKFMDSNNKLIFIMKNACEEMDKFINLSDELGGVLSDKTKKEIEYISSSMSGLERMLRELKY